MAENQDVKKVEYVSLMDISGKGYKSVWTVKQGKPVTGNILEQIGGPDEAVKRGLICLKENYDTIIEKQKKSDDEAIKKSEDARDKMIKQREEKHKKVKLKKVSE